MLSSLLKFFRWDGWCLPQWTCSVIALDLMRTWQMWWLNTPVSHCDDTDQQYLSIGMFLENDWCVFYSHQWLMCVVGVVFCSDQNCVDKMLGFSQNAKKNPSFIFKWKMKNDKVILKNRGTCFNSLVCFCGSLPTYWCQKTEFSAGSSLCTETNCPAVWRLRLHVNDITTVLIKGLVHKFSSLSLINSHVAIWTLK